MDTNTLTISKAPATSVDASLKYVYVKAIDTVGNITMKSVAEVSVE